MALRCGCNELEGCSLGKLLFRFGRLRQLRRHLEEEVSGTSKRLLPRPRREVVFVRAVKLALFAILLGACSDRPVVCRQKFFAAGDYSNVRCGDGYVRVDRLDNSFLCCLEGSR